jgi:hypothetical protein
MASAPATKPGSLRGSMMSSIPRTCKHEYCDSRFGERRSASAFSTVVRLFCSDAANASEAKWFTCGSVCRYGPQTRAQSIGSESVHDEWLHEYRSEEGSLIGMIFQLQSVITLVVLGINFDVDGACRG